MERENKERLLVYVWVFHYFFLEAKTEYWTTAARQCDLQRRPELGALQGKYVSFKTQWITGSFIYYGNLAED